MRKVELKTLSEAELSRILAASCGDNSRQCRKELHMTQEELAQQLFVAQQTIHKWENNINEPSIEMLKKLKVIFSISVDALIQ
ncbi:helix-turn-helix domain-containing protein [Streptococcus merionis]|uniref:helix-turn-helix domain-containing protein n=1 Tax=Streptococcus merionis TaxID=400065 RepID=UPI003514DB07